MEKISELRQALGVAEDELTALKEKGDTHVKLSAARKGLAALATDAKAFDAKKVEIADLAAKAKREEEGLEERVKDLKARIESAEAAQKLAAAQARPAGEGRSALPAAVRARYSGLKAFKDRRDDHGQVVRAEEQAYRMGQFILASIYDVSKAAEWCRDNGIVLTRAQAEGVNSAGGWLVPEEMMASIIDLREQYGVFRREAQVVPMGRDTMNWPRRSGGVTAYFVAEGVAATESQASWDNVNLTAKKLAALVRMSTEIAEDAIINVADWITNEIAYAFASKEDDCGFNGDGTSTYGGILGVCNLNKMGSAGLYTATGHATFDVITATDIENMRALLPFYALPNAKIYCSQYAFALCFERLVAAGGGNSIATLNGEVQYRYLGTPIVICQKMPSTSPTGTIGMLYGDLKKAAAVGERRQVTIQRSEHRYMDTDQIGIFGNERVDINVHDAGSSTTAGPIVALKMG